MPSLYQERSFDPFQLELKRESDVRVTGLRYPALWPLAATGGRWQSERHGLRVQILKAPRVLEDVSVDRLPNRFNCFAACKMEDVSDFL